MKKFKKILSMLLIIVFSISVVPSNEVQAKKKISDELLSRIQKGIECFSYQRNELGLDDVDFSTLKIGNIIHAYEYKDDTMCELEFTLYPIYSKKKIIAFAIDDPAKENIDITTQLVEEVSNCTESKKPFALVYDSEGCYLYSKQGVKLLKKIQDKEIAKTRKKLKLDDSMSEFKSCKIEESSESISMDDSSDDTISIMSSNYYSCPVSYYSQFTKNLCWAACVACIGNYKTHNSYSSFAVALEYASMYNDSWDQSRYLFESVNALKDVCGVYYTDYNSLPNQNIILNSILNDRPLMASFTGDIIEHEVVIYGINIMYNGLSVMDPANGFASASVDRSGLYKYTSLSSGRIYHFTSYAC